MSEMVMDHLGGEFGLTAKIKDALLETRKQFVYIGFLLDEADRCEYYREGGYDSIYDYCEATFGFKKSSTNNFIRVYRCFGEAMGLQSRYRDFSYSQLTEMCSMSPKEIEKCRPDMTVMDIRVVKKGDAFQISGKTEGGISDLHSKLRFLKWFEKYNLQLFVDLCSQYSSWLSAAKEDNADG